MSVDRWLALSSDAHPHYTHINRIHHISFGDEYPGRINPLDGKVRFLASVAWMGWDGMDSGSHDNVNPQQP